MSEIETVYEGKFRTRTSKGGESRIVTDLAQDFSPIDLFAASLSSCLLTIMAKAAEKMGLNIDGSKVSVKKEMSRDLPRRVSKIQVDFFCTSEFSGEIREKLEIAAKTCPVHYSLHPDLEQVFFFQWGMP